MFKITFYSGLTRAHVVNNVSLGELPAVLAKVLEFMKSVNTKITQIVFKPIIVSEVKK